MKHLITILLLNTCSMLFGQDVKIIGIVTDAETNQSIELATIVAYSNTNLITGTSTNSKGEFSLTVEVDFDYIEISFIGYKTITLTTEEIANTIPLIVKMEVDADALEEVVIEGKKMVVQTKIDRKVINLGSDIQNSGVNALEAFGQIPEIQADVGSGIISLRGNDNIHVLVNGKLSPLSPVELLQQIPASSIKQVEVITSPSAKQRASGLSGIINIILKKNINSGLNLSINSSVGTRRYGFGINANYNLSWMNVRLNASSTNLKTINNQTISRTFSNGNKEDIFTPYIFDGTVYNITTGFDFFIRNKHELSFDFNYTDDSHSNTLTSSYTNVTDSDDYTYLRENAHFHYITIFNGNYRLNFNNKSHFLEVDYNINGSKNDYPLSDFENSTLLFNQFLTENFILQSGVIDYSLPINEKLQFESGMGLNTQELNSTQRIDPASEPETNNSFDYFETIWSIYGQGKLSIGNLNIQGGLRYEYFESDSKSETTNFETSWKFSNLFPSIHFSYQFNENNTFNLGYSKRVSRPDFHQINAFQIVNPLFIWEYNPDIQPEFSDNFDLSYQGEIKGLTFNLATFYRHRTDVILWTERSSEEQQVFRYENVGIFNSYGIEGSANFKIKPFWSSRLSANYYFTKIKQSRFVTWDNIYSSTFQIKNTIDLNQTISFDATYHYNPKRQNAFNYDRFRKRLDVAFRGKFYNNKLTFGLRIVDVFNENYFVRNSQTDNLHQTTRWDIQNAKRSFLFNLNYKLFEGSLKPRNRKKRNYNKAPID